MAIGVPFGGGVAWPADWAGRFEIVSSQLLDGRIAGIDALPLTGQ